MDAAALRRRPGIRPGEVTAAGSQSFPPVEARQVGAGRAAEPYPDCGLDDAFLRHTTFGLGAIARGYGSGRRRRPARAGDGGPGDRAAAGPLRVRADPVPVEISDPQTGGRLRLTVIGVLKDTAPLEMAGVSTSRRALAAAFPGRTRPTVHFLVAGPGVDHDDLAARVEGDFLATGAEAESIRGVVDEVTAASLTFSRLIQGFMGTGLGLLLAENIIRDSRRQPSWENLTLVAPWTNLAVILAVVHAVALLATLAPALRASRTRPAEVLRYR